MQTKGVLQEIKTSFLSGRKVGKFIYSILKLSHKNFRVIVHTCTPPKKRFTSERNSLKGNFSSNT